MSDSKTTPFDPMEAKYLGAVNQRDQARGELRRTRLELHDCRQFSTDQARKLRMVTDTLGLRPDASTAAIVERMRELRRIPVQRTRH